METQNNTQIEKYLAANIYFQDIPATRRSSLVAAWCELYPDEWVLRELKKANAWLLSNPTRQKKNYARFLTAWLARGRKSMTAPCLRATTHRQAPPAADDPYTGIGTRI
jgi:hypothetical protein